MLSRPELRELPARANFNASDLVTPDPPQPECRWVNPQENEFALVAQTQPPGDVRPDGPSRLDVLWGGYSTPQFACRVISKPARLRSVPSDDEIRQMSNDEWRAYTGSAIRLGT